LTAPPAPPPPNPSIAAPVRRPLSIPNLSQLLPWRRTRPAAAPRPPDGAALLSAVEDTVAVEVPPEEAVPLPEAVPEPMPPAPPVDEPSLPPPAAEAPADEAAVPEEPPAEAETAEPPAGPDLPVTVPDTEPAADMPVEGAPEVSEEPAVSAEPEASAEPEEPDPAPAQETENGGHFVPLTRGFAYVAPAPARVQRRRSEAGIIAAAVLLLLIVAGILGSWFYGARPRGALSSPEAVAREYLFALRMGDSVSRQRLVLEATRGLQTPPWFLISEIAMGSTPTRKGDRIIFPVHVTLLPAEPETLTDAVRAAVSVTYAVALPLQQVRGAWRVDQRAFFHNVYVQIKTAHPDVRLPAWPRVVQ